MRDLPPSWEKGQANVVRGRQALAEGQVSDVACHCLPGIRQGGFFAVECGVRLIRARNPLVGPAGYASAWEQAACLTTAAPTQSPLRMPMMP